MHDILVAPFCRMVDTFLKRPLEMRHRVCATPKPHLRAQVVASPLTSPAAVVRHTDLQSNAVTNLVTGNILADGDHNPGRLVA